jgi:hypothetical protein
MKAELKKLRQMEINLSSKLQAEIPKYKKDDIKKLPLYTYRLIPEKTSALVDGKKQDVWLAPERLKFKNKLRTRNRLNKTVKMFNKFGDNEDKAMKYFLAKTTFIR